jgi:small subunit ribosomal protein S14
MAKVSAVAKNNRRAEIIERDFEKRKKLKDVLMSKETTDQEKFEAQSKLAKLPRDGAKIRYRNRCNVTGKPRGYYRDFGISRISLRESSGFGLIPGVIKSSW